MPIEDETEQKEISESDKYEKALIRDGTHRFLDCRFPSSVEDLAKNFLLASNNVAETLILEAPKLSEIDKGILLSKMKTYQHAAYVVNGFIASQKALKEEKADES